jgi:hypothetical protein
LLERHLVSRIITSLIPARSLLNVGEKGATMRFAQFILKILAEAGKAHYFRDVGASSRRMSLFVES